MSEPTRMTPLSRIEAGSLLASGAELACALLLLPPLSLFLVWSPQPVRIRAPATAIAPTAARRWCAAVVRRVELAVILGSSGDGWSCRWVDENTHLRVSRPRGF